MQTYVQGDLEAYDASGLKRRGTKGTEQEFYGPHDINRYLRLIS